MKDRIKMLCKQNGVSLFQVEQALGFAKGYLSKLGKSTPNAAKIKAIADYFGVSVDYLMNGDDTSEPYYLNDETRELAQFLFENPEYRTAFDAIRTVRKEDLEFVKELIDRTSR